MRTGPRRQGDRQRQRGGSQARSLEGGLSLVVQGNPGRQIMPLNCLIPSQEPGDSHLSTVVGGRVPGIFSSPYLQAEVH